MKRKPDLDELGERLTEQELKDIVKEAIKEWLDDVMATFGRWSAMTIAGLALVLLLYFVLITNGWHK